MEGKTPHGGGGACVRMLTNMNTKRVLVNLGSITLASAALMAFTGCVGWVDGGGGYGAVVVAPEPDVFFYGGGFYDRGHEVRGYSARGAASRGAAHGGGHGGGRR